MVFYKVCQFTPPLWLFSVNHLGFPHLVLAAQSCPTLFDSMDCSPPGSSVHGIVQARILEWGDIPFSRASSRPREWTRVCCRQILYQSPGNPFRILNNTYCCLHFQSHPLCRISDSLMTQKAGNQFIWISLLTKCLFKYKFSVGQLIGLDWWDWASCNPLDWRCNFFLPLVNIYTYTHTHTHTHTHIYI